MTGLNHVYFRKIVEYFRGDHAKAWAWFNTWNPSLGAIPYNMVKKNRAKQVMAFIDDHMKGFYS